MANKSSHGIQSIIREELKEFGKTLNKSVDQKFVVFGKALNRNIDQKFIHFRKAMRNDMVVVLGEFFENILAPYLDEHVEKRFDNLEERVGKIEKRQSLS